MSKTLDLNRTLESIADRKGVFQTEAYFFVLQALETGMSAQGDKVHISGQDLLDCIREIGRDRFGPMAGDVFNSWGVRSTLDFGRIVFHLVEEGLLRKRKQDSLADFVDRFDFQEEFSLKVFEAES